MASGSSTAFRRGSTAPKPSSKTWATMWVYCAILAVMFLSKFASGSYLYAMLTTIEKAFGLSATEIAGLKSMGGATYSVSMVFVMILAKKVHVPRTIAMASVGIGLAFFIQLIPYLYGEGRGSMESLKNGANSSLLDDIDLRRPLCYSVDVQRELRLEQCGDEGINETMITEKTGPAKTDGSSREYGFLAAGKVTTMLLGPFVVILYAPFIDNNAPSHKAALYISVVKALQFIGPLIGMGLGSYLSQMPVDLKPVDISPKDPQFVGAWWIGILIFGPLLLLASLPMFFFPSKPYMSEEEQLAQEKANAPEGENCLVMQEENPDDDGEDGETLYVVVQDEGKDDPEDSESIDGVIGFLKAFWLHMKDFFKNVYEILINKMWVSCYIGDLVSGFGWGGMFTFLPKTLELQYRFPAWQTGIILGIVIGGGGGLGTLLSGFVVRKLDLKPPGMALHVIIVRCIYVVCLISMIFLTSNGANIHGEIDSQTGLIALNATCNDACHCGQEAFYPICGDDNRNYFSPCHAGCRDVYKEDKLFFFANCSCIDGGNGGAQQGYCEQQTSSVGFAYVALLFSWLFIACSNSMSQFLFKFRALKPEQKALSVGLSSLTRSLVGAVISNMIYGRFIDSSCLIWREKCDVRKNCYFYDMYKYHLIVHGGCAFFSFLSTLLYGVGYYFARQRNWDHLDKKKENDNNNNVKNNHNISNGTSIQEGRAKQLLNRTGQKLKSLTAAA